MGIIVKILLSCFLSIFIVPKLTESCTNIVDATEPDESTIANEQFEATTQGLGHGESTPLTAAENLNIVKNSLKEPLNENFLNPSKAESLFYDNNELPSKLTTASEVSVFSSTDTTEEFKENILSSQLQNENINNSHHYFNESDQKEFDPLVEVKLKIDEVLEKTMHKQPNESESGTISSHEDFKKTTSHHEDIPSFSEWTQKQLAEAEKKKTDQNETFDRFTKLRGKFRIKNYASPDCGAKIVAANPESLSSSSVLSSLKDEYMLNYCTNRIWFIVELCEAIQAKQLDLANFELFSSSPKHFSVFVSHRFPTREWSNVGKFTAQDSRDVQTFNLQPYFFGKFIKVEMHSHYGKEQFCPISWIGIYGTSEYEVLAKEDERNSLSEDDDTDPYDEEIYIGHKRDSPKNLFSSATDAVLSIVKKATAPFMKSDINQTEISNYSRTVNIKNASCVTPRFVITCNNCSQSFYDTVFNILSCELPSLEKLVYNSFVHRALIHDKGCAELGLDFNSFHSSNSHNYLETSSQDIKYLRAILKNASVAALCNVLAVVENKTTMNTTLQDTYTLKNLTQKKENCEEIGPSKTSIPGSPSTVSNQFSGDCTHSLEFQYTSSAFPDTSKMSENDPRKIEPTKTLSEYEAEVFSFSNFKPESSTTLPKDKLTELPTTEYVKSSAITPSIQVEKVNYDVEKKDVKISVEETRSNFQKDMSSENKSSNSLNNDPTLESIISDINAIEKVVASSPSSIQPSSNLPTESIFLRLANRIKILEVNMSLSSTYLEELSKRYRTQLELLSKTLNLTIQKVEEQTKLEEEKERKREKEILLIRMQLANLTRDISAFFREKDGWRPQASSLSQHIFFILVEVLLIWIIFSYWKKYTEKKCTLLEGTKKLNKKYKRRSSLEGVKGHETPKSKIRRPSEEALDIALSRTYKLERKRKKRKKESKCSLNGIQTKRKSSEVDVPQISLSHLQTTNKCTSNANIQDMKTEVIPYNLLSRESSNQFSKTDSMSGMSSQNSSNSSAKSLQGLAPPGFMRTALAARDSRLRAGHNKESSQEFVVDQREKRLK